MAISLAMSTNIVWALAWANMYRNSTKACSVVTIPDNSIMDLVHTAYTDTI